MSRIHCDSITIEIEHSGLLVASINAPCAITLDQDYEEDVNRIFNQGAKWFLKAASIFGLTHNISEYEIEVKLHRGY